MGSTRARSPRRPEPPPLSDADRHVLAFLAEHRLARVDHLLAFLAAKAGVAAGHLDGGGRATVAARLDGLAAGGLVRVRAVFEGHPPSVQVTARGLAAIGSDLPTPRLDLRGYAHDVGVAWVWLAARAGAFGELREIIAERRLRSLDGPGRRSDPPLAVRLGGVGPRGEERLHYPDLVLVTAGGRRVAVELELTGKSRARRERILAGYGADPRVDAVLYLVRDRRVGTAIADTARRLGISRRISVQLAAFTEPVDPPDVGRLVDRAWARAPDGAARVADADAEASR